MIKINKSPVLTSQNYGINYFEIDKNLLNQKFDKFETYKIKNDQNVKVEAFNKKISNPMSNELSIQSQNQANFQKQIVFENTSKDITNIKFDVSRPLADVIDIVVKKDASAKLILEYSSNENMYHNGVIDLTLEKDAELDIVILYNMKNSSNNFVSINSNLDNNSQLNIFIIDFGCQNSVQRLENSLNGDYSVFSLNSIYFGSNTDNLGVNYLSNVFGKSTQTYMNSICVLDGHAKKNFVGTIDFKQGSKKSVGDVSENCIMLSKTAKSLSTPILLCGEEDVDGKHSSSLGKIDEDELFYMMTRGISKQDAIKLLIKAKLSKLLNNIFDDKLKEQIQKRIEEKLNED